MKKGQGAMEYLMTYGWALLVIVVAGAALFALGVLNPSTYAQKRCQGFPSFTYQDHNANQTHFVLDIINKAPSTITISALEIDGAAVTGLTTTPAGNILGSTRFTVEGDYAGALTTGQQFSYTVGLRYDVVGGIQGKLDTGTCTGTIA